MSESVDDFRALGAEDQVDQLEKLLDQGALDPQTNPPQRAREAPPVEDASDEDAPAPDETDQPDDEEDTLDPDSPFIEPPSSLPKDFHNEWANVPAPLAAKLVELDRARQTEVRRVQNETAEIKKLAQANSSQIEQERSFLAQRIVPAIQAITQQLYSEYSDEALQTLARTNPALWAQKFEERRQMERQQSELAQTHAGMTQENAKATREREFSLLFEKAPEWQDKERFAADGEKLYAEAAKYGYSADEVASVVDHRALLLLKRMAFLEAREAARQAPARKVAQQTPPRTIAPRNRNDGASQAARSRETYTNIARSGDSAAIENALSDMIGRGALG